MKAIRVWYAVDRDGEGYFYTKAPYRDVDSELFNGVETPNITWYDTPIEFEMKYEIAEKS